MSKFMTEDFLLNTETARVLYHEHAEQMPIIDYHCHIPAADILNDVKFENITKLWLAADHYKWRLIRANGEDESLVTGDASDYERFLAFARMLPRTVLYSLNPNDNNALCSLAGSFQGSTCPGKIQHGSAWWFNDTKEGMSAQLKTLAEGGLLGNFIGMLTDSRSFLSYTRHEYFRRILCRILGQWVEDGEYPADMETLGELVEDICCNNARAYFGL